MKPYCDIFALVGLGCYKTTLARAVFDRISIHFDGKAFVENVRELSKSSLYGLNKLQQQVLSSVLSKGNITVSSVYDGTNMMKRMIRGRKVLIVLDDVDDIEQLEALAGEPHWFKLGSRVIITTRDKQVLLARQVKCTNVSLLSHVEAISLFSKYAFLKDIRTEGYEELSKEVVQYADGLPLTIKVLGSLLCGQNLPQWIDTLERLKKIPLKATMEKLELSYIGLEEDYKEIFLDVACLMKGWHKNDAINALESCGFFARAGLRVLEQRSLINISEWGELGMHDHIEEMGMNIVRRVNPDEPKWHSRLWIREEIEDILANDSATQATKCIRLNAPRLNFEIVMKGLANMDELRFLHVYRKYANEDEVSNRNFDEESLHLPNALRFLRWMGYPFSSLLKTFQAKKACLNLRFLKLTNLHRLSRFDLSVAPNLETLFLQDYHNLVEVHFQVTPNLKKLRIHNCSRMKFFYMPAEYPKLVYLDLHNLRLRAIQLGITPNLETFSLGARNFHNSDMVELRMPTECPKLVTLQIYNLKLRTLHLGFTPNLEKLSLNKCTFMAELQIPVECPKLVELNLSLCIQVAELPEEIGWLECLKELDIIGTSITHLPESIFRRKGLRIVGSRQILESCGFTSEIKTSNYKTFCYI